MRNPDKFIKSYDFIDEYFKAAPNVSNKEQVYGKMMNKGLFFLGTALLFASYHMLVDKTVSVGMYEISISDNVIANIIGIAISLAALIILFVSFCKKYKCYVCIGN